MTAERTVAPAVRASAVQAAWVYINQRRIATLGIAILGLLLLIAAFAPIIAPYDPAVRTGLPFEHPSASHVLGTNDIGQDILSQLIVGTRISLLVGAIGAIGAVGLGTLVGLTSGYFVGSVDQVLMRMTDGVLILPFLPLMIVLAAFAGPSVNNLVLVIALVWWAQTARIVRSRTLTLRERGFVDAARALGASNLRIMARYLLPLTLPLALVQFIYVAAQVILIEASLSFLGLGDPTAQTWGSMLYWAQARGAFLNESWLWWILPPGLAISLTVIGFTYAGYFVEDLLDPRLRRR